MRTQQDVKTRGTTKIKPQRQVAQKAFQAVMSGRTPQQTLPQKQATTECKVTEEMVERARQRTNMDIAIKQLTKDHDAIDREFKGYMEERKALTAMFRGQVVCQLTPWGPRVLIDADRLREERPDLAEEYSKSVSGFTPKYSV